MRSRITRLLPVCCLAVVSCNMGKEAEAPRAGRPGAPTGVQAGPGDSRATVNWQPSSSNGGSALTANTVTSAPGPVSVIVGGDKTTATVPGLTNGTSYTFTVVATNSAGDSPASAPSPAVVPRT